MRKPIFESEEEAINFIENCIAFKGDIENLNISKSLLLIKSKGYIRRNPVEEWENSMAEWNNAAWENSHYERHIEVIKIFENKLKIADDAIQYLQNQIVELNKKVGEE